MARCFLIFIVIFVFTKNSLASSCCGGSPIVFHLPQNNQRLNFNFGASQINGVGRVFQESEDFIEWTSRDRILEVLNFSGSYMLMDRLSLSLQSGFFFSTYADNFVQVNDQNWGDSLLALNFEALPEYTYSRFRPKIFTSLLLNLPTGRSIFEDGASPEGANVTGHGLWGLGLGLTFNKTWSPYMLNIQTRGLQIFSGTIDNQRISNYFDFSTSVRLTRFIFDKWGVLTGLDWSYISKRERNFFEVIGDNLQALSSQRTSVVFGINYSLNSDSTLSFTYSDESLLGQPRNTVINRTIALNFNQTIN
jgi:hypothetical protein